MAYQLKHLIKQRSAVMRIKRLNILMVLKVMLKEQVRKKGLENKRCREQKGKGF